MAEQKKSNYLIVISAPSGAGKTTLCQKLLVDFPELILSVSSTTRQPRGKERNGIDYFFIPKEEFEKRIRENRFVEWAQVHGNYYGTSKEVVDSAFAANRSVLLDIDIQGAEQIRKAYPEKCFTIFISPPSLKELESRLRNRRTDSEETIQKRLRHAKFEMAAGEKFNCVIINDFLSKAYNELKKLIETNLCLQSKKDKNA